MKEKRRSELIRDGFTIMLISHRGEIKQFYLPRKVAKILGIISIVVVLIVAYAAVSYSSLVVQAGRVAALEERNRKLEERLKKIHALERQVKELQEVRSRLYELLGADSASMAELREITHQDLSQNLANQKPLTPISTPLQASEFSPPIDSSEQKVEEGQPQPPNDIPSGLPVATESYRITLGYSEQHKGIDIATTYNTPVIATADGIVKFVGKDELYGLHIIIHHNSGYETLYAHLSHVRVQPGEAVTRGQIIGFVGVTGHTSGPHVHYEIHKGKRTFDPTKFLYSAR